MLRLSKLTDYAVVVLVRLAGMEGVQTSPGISAATGIPEPTVAKVLKTLAAGDLVSSQRGARGGYRLNRDLAAIPIADVIACVDGPIALIEGPPSPIVAPRPPSRPGRDLGTEISPPRRQ